MKRGGTGNAEYVMVTFLLLKDRSLIEAPCVRVQTFTQFHFLLLKDRSLIEAFETVLTFAASVRFRTFQINISESTRYGARVHYMSTHLASRGIPCQWTTTRS